MMAQFNSLEDRLYQVFVDAVNHAFRPDVFVRVVNIESGYERFKYANEIFDSEIEPQLPGELESERVNLFYEFAVNLRKVWANLEILDELGGAAYYQVDSSARNVADMTMQSFQDKFVNIKGLRRGL